MSTASLAIYGIWKTNIIIIFPAVNQIRQMAKIFSRKPGLDDIQATGIAAGFGIGNARGWDKKIEAED